MEENNKLGVVFQIYLSLMSVKGKPQECRRSGTSVSYFEGKSILVLKLEDPFDQESTEIQIHENALF